MSAIDDLLESLRRNGVAIRAHQGRLQLRPRTGVDAATLAEIERYKPALLVRLASGGGVPPSTPRPALATSVPTAMSAMSPPDPPWPRGPQHCMTCWGTRFVDLRDGRRWACFTCAAPEPGDVVAECANGPERSERARAGARVAGERAASAGAADGATQSQASCGREVTEDRNRPNGAGETGDGNSNR